MRSIFIKVFLLQSLIQLIFLFGSIQAQCNTTKTCLHGGYLNKTCHCECLAPYRGERCEYGDCTKESSACTTNFGPALCTNIQIKDNCPKMCQQIICACTFDSCENAGTFNPTTCTCFCPQTYTGKRCEILFSPQQTNTTTASPVSNTASSSTNIGTATTSITTKTTNSTTTKPQCLVILPCQNGGIFNPDTCKCQCYPSFDGILCEECVIENQPSVCEKLTSEVCKNPSYLYLCPLLCNSDSCQSRLCLCSNNGTVINDRTCDCACPAEYTGNKCQFARDPCTVEDSPDCSNIDCWSNQNEEILIKCQRKCFCCNNKKCYNSGVLSTSLSDSNNKCECKCINQAFDPKTNCEKPSPNCNDQFSACLDVFGPLRCNDPTISAYCPKMCGIC